MLVNVFFGGMRSITFVQAFQYWLKLTALLVPVMFLLAVWNGDGATSPASARRRLGVGPLDSADAHPLYTTYSLIVATFLGTMGLPHVVVRFYTNPDGRTARRTTLVVLACSGCSTCCRPCTARSAGSTHRTCVADGCDRHRRARAAARGWSAALGGELLSALTAAGAFAAFLSTSSGLTIAVAGVLSQDVMGRRLPRACGPSRRRRSSRSSCPLLLAVSAEGVGVARAVGLAFAVAASTFCPLLVLGIWWRRLTDAGAIAGMLVGGRAVRRRRSCSRWSDGAAPGWPGALLVAAGRVDGAGGVRDDGRRLAADAGPAARARLPHDGPAAHPRGRRARPRAAAALTAPRPRADRSSCVSGRSATPAPAGRTPAAAYSPRGAGASLA